MLDEHIDRTVQRQLLRRDVRMEILSVGDTGAPANGTSDRDILIWLEQHDYMLVTKNRSTMPGHYANHMAAGGHVPGVLCIRPNVTVGQIMDELYLIWQASTADEYRDRVAFIPF